MPQPKDCTGANKGGWSPMSFWRGIGNGNRRSEVDGQTVVCLDEKEEHGGLLGGVSKMRMRSCKKVLLEDGS